MSASGERFLGFKRHLRAALVPGEAAYLLSAHGVTALRGRHFEVLAPLLDGSRTLATLVREASPELSAGEVGLVIGRLAEANLLAVRDETFADRPDAEEAYWDLAGLDGALARTAMAGSPVEIVAVGAVEAAALGDACRE
jgi:oxazoline/thiazoline synthase